MPKQFKHFGQFSELISSMLIALKISLELAGLS